MTPDPTEAAKKPEQEQSKAARAIAAAREFSDQFLPEPTYRGAYKLMNRLATLLEASEGEIERLRKRVEELESGEIKPRKTCPCFIYLSSGPDPSCPIHGKADQS